MGRVHMGRCTLAHHGCLTRYHRFEKDFPNMEYNAAESDVTEEEAYRLTYPIAWADGMKRITRKQRQCRQVLQVHTGPLQLLRYVEQGMHRACMDSLERRNGIENRFKNSFSEKGWTLPVESRGKGVINPFRRGT